MKFGKHLLAEMQPEWRFNFIDYSGLKGFLKSNVKATQWNDQLEAEFISRLDDELKKVSGFSYVKHKEVQRHIEYATQQVKKADSHMYASKREALLAELNEISEDIKRLAKYNSLNYTAFVKILKKHDKMAGIPLAMTFMTRITSQPFYKETFDSSILSLSRLYAQLRPCQPQSAQTALAQGYWARYWVQREGATAAKLIITKNLPVLACEDGSRLGPSCSITVNTVYYDNKDLQHYHELSENKEGAQSVRFRYYNQADSEVFAERKTFHVGGVSETDSIALKEKNVNKFVNGTYNLDHQRERMKAQDIPNAQIEATVKFAEDTQRMIIDEKLEAVVRCQYERTVFQHPNNMKVRVTLDTELVFTRASGSVADGWKGFRDDGVPEPTNNFPFDVLEVWVAPGEPLPSWARSLNTSPLLHSVPKFSKFVHGCAVLREESVRLLPFWLPKIEKRLTPSLPESTESVSTRTNSEEGDGTQTNANDSGVQPTRREHGLSSQRMGSSAQLDDARETTPLLPEKRRSIGFKALLKRCLGAQHAAQNQKAVAMFKIEPKMHFSNERTFLSWLQMAVFISSLALALLNLNGSSQQSRGRGSKIAGVTMLPVAMLILVYALYTYFWRYRHIVAKYPGPYNTIGGPIFLTATFFFSLLFNYIMWFVDHGTVISEWGRKN